MLGRLAARLVTAQGFWARPVGDFVHRVLAAVFRPLRPIKSFLNGKWLGHSLHAALTDVPVGVFTLAILLDLLDMREAADIAIVFGILAVAAALVAGLADFTDTDGQARATATVHATLILVAAVAYLASLAMRLADPAGDRLLPIVVSLVGYGLLTAGAWVGGEVVYALGNMVSRHAWRFAGTAGWIKLDTTEIPEGVPLRTKAGAQQILLVREGATIHALHEVCAHAGGPLSEGRIIDGCIECPWHFSRYELATGRRKSGPTTFDQPRYEIRTAEGGGYEVRRVTGLVSQNY